MTYDEMDELVDTDPIRLRDECWRLHQALVEIGTTAYVDGAHLRHIARVAVSLPAGGGDPGVPALGQEDGRA